MMEQMVKALIEHAGYDGHISRHAPEERLNRVKQQLKNQVK